MTHDIERQSERDFQRALERGPAGRSPARQAAAGGALSAGSAGVIAAFPELTAYALTPLYVAAAVGLLVIAHAGVTWLRNRRRARLDPPIPPARLLPPDHGPPGPID